MILNRNHLFLNVILYGFSPPIVCYNFFFYYKLILILEWIYRSGFSRKAQSASLLSLEASLEYSKSKSSLEYSRTNQDPASFTCRFYFENRKSLKKRNLKFKRFINCFLFLDFIVYTSLGTQRCPSY